MSTQIVARVIARIVVVVRIPDMIMPRVAPSM
jgi:hypothetical protein